MDPKSKLFSTLQPHALKTLPTSSPFPHLPDNDLHSVISINPINPPQPRNPVTLETALSKIEQILTTLTTIDECKLYPPDPNFLSANLG